MTAPGLGLGFRRDLEVFFPEMKQKWRLVHAKEEPYLEDVWHCYIGKLHEGSRAWIWARINDNAPLGLEFVHCTGKETVLQGPVPEIVAGLREGKLLRDLIKFDGRSHDGTKNVAFSEMMRGARPEHANALLSGLVRTLLLTDTWDYQLPAKWYRKYTGNERRGIYLRPDVPDENVYPHRNVAL